MGGEWKQTLYNTRMQECSHAHGAHVAKKQTLSYDTNSVKERKVYICDRMRDGAWMWRLWADPLRQLNTRVYTA